MADKYKLQAGRHALIEELNAGKILRYRLIEQHRSMSFGAFIHTLASDAAFREGFNSLLSDAPFSAYRFETPALCTTNVDHPFEFVLIDAPTLADAAADVRTFGQYFSDAKFELSKQLVEFKSLGGDATLIVPTPLVDHVLYKHLASFCRSAPGSQTDSLWQVVAKELLQQLGASPVWLNTEGSGVAWLHVRIDTQPKYYGFDPYKSIEGFGLQRAIQ